MIIRLILNPGSRSRSGGLTWISPHSHVSKSAGMRGIGAADASDANMLAAATASTSLVISLSFPSSLLVQGEMQDCVPKPRRTFSARSVVSRTARCSRLVTVRQTFVRLPLAGVEDEQGDLFSPNSGRGLGFNPDGPMGSYPSGERAPKKRCAPSCSHSPLTHMQPRWRRAIIFGWW